jgi:hypothetical protein
MISETLTSSSEPVLFRLPSPFQSRGKLLRALRQFDAVDISTLGEALAGALSALFK